MKKFPDHIVQTDGKFDANIKRYPTNLGAPSFEPIVTDKSDRIKANKYFESRLNELREEYKELVDEYSWTKLVYQSTYNFQPILGEPYHLYEDDDRDLFLSLIGPNEWNRKYIGTFKLLNNGKWQII
tara:strand:+ start:3189 stop:3569 length:381 start_codon:yes stop_codon:yes gene_type:complete